MAIPYGNLALYICYLSELKSSRERKRRAIITFNLEYFATIVILLLIAQVLLCIYA